MKINGTRCNDTLYGTNTNDSLDGLAGHDRLYGRDGNDALHGGFGNDNLYGGAGKDTLSGGAGNDRLYGGLGADVLDGGAGKDVFVFRSIAEIFGDTIGDFHKKEDRIDLSAIDANITRKGNQAFDYIGDDAFSGTAGEISIHRTGDWTRVEGDVNGDALPDFSLTVQPGIKLEEGDFVL